MMKSLVSSFFLLISPVMAIEDETAQPGFLSSDEAHYDGAQLLLQGHVFINHPLGRMQAQTACIDKQEENKIQPFTFISLENEVLLSLLPASEVHCDHAFFNFKILKAILSSSSSPSVIYKDLIQTSKTNPSVSVCLASRNLEIDFVQEKEPSAKYIPSSLLAQDNVTFSYGSDIHLSADKILYHKGSPSSSIPSLQGMLTAYSKGENPSCVLHYHDQEMTSEKIEIDFTRSSLHLTSPQGKLPTCFSLTPQPLAFKANILDWDEANNHISLLGDIVLEDPSFGTLRTKEKIDVLLDKKETWWIRKITTTGPSLLTYQDEASRVHEVAAPGPIQINGEKKSALLQSANGQPLCYQSDQFVIFANQAVIEYQETNGKSLPSLLTLQGDVKLISQETKGAQKVGLADLLVYHFADQRCLLSADPGKQVLFSEGGTTGACLSAPKIQILSDPVTKEPIIQGVGAVQFSFTPDEESKIEHFLTELSKKR